MNGQQFIRRARRYARRNGGLECYFDPDRGKGSHGTLYIGRRNTVVQHGEIPLGTFMDMLKDLDIDRRRF